MSRPTGNHDERHNPQHGDDEPMATRQFMPPRYTEFDGEHMASDLLKGLDPKCPVLNEIAGRVEKHVADSGLRGKAAIAAENAEIAPLLAEHRATCARCRAY